MSGTSRGGVRYGQGRSRCAAPGASKTIAGRRQALRRGRRARRQRRPTREGSLPELEPELRPAHAHRRAAQERGFHRDVADRHTLGMRRDVLVDHELTRPRRRAACTDVRGDDHPVDDVGVRAGARRPGSGIGDAGRETAEDDAGEERRVAPLDPRALGRWPRLVRRGASRHPGIVRPQPPSVPLAAPLPCPQWSGSPAAGLLWRCPALRGVLPACGPVVAFTMPMWWAVARRPEAGQRCHRGRHFPSRAASSWQ